MPCIFPEQINNSFRGNRLALWLFGFVVSLRILQSLAVLFNGRSIVISADGVPVDTFSPDSAAAVVAIFALCGLYRLIFSLLCVVVLWRYQGAVPFMFAVVVLEYLAKQTVLYFIPLARTGTPPGPVVNLLLFLMALAGLGLSLHSRRTDAAA